MSEIVGLAIRITPQNREALAYVNQGVVAPEAETVGNDEYFVLPYDPTCRPVVLPGYAFRENFEFAFPRSDKYFVQIREI